MVETRATAHRLRRIYYCLQYILKEAANVEKIRFVVYSGDTSNRYSREDALVCWPKEITNDKLVCSLRQVVGSLD